MKLYEKQFSVAVYNTARLFGGHEEGGWWYTDREKVKDVLVTGATGGVGSIAVMILNHYNIA